MRYERQDERFAAAVEIQVCTRPSKRWRLTRFIGQRIARGIWARKRVIYLQRYYGARTIQRHWKGFHTRQRVSAYRQAKLEREAAACLQRFWRTMLEKKELGHRRLMIAQCHGVRLI